VVLAAQPQAAAPKPEPAARKLVKLPEKLGQNVMESTPFVYRGKLLMFHSRRVDVPKPDLSQMVLLLADPASGRELVRFGQRHSLGSAFVDGDTIHVFAAYHSEHDWFHDIDHFWSSDLAHWQQEPALVREAGEHLLNSSVCRDEQGFLMAYESDRPVGFCFKFARSSDLKKWNKIPGLAFTGERREYSACPVIRYFRPYYYVIYLHAAIPAHNGWVSFLARSKDLATWQLSPQNPILEAGPGEGSNNSDVDLVELDGKTYVYYCTGDQRTWGDLKRAVYPGPMAEFFAGYFPAGQKTIEVSARQPPETLADATAWLRAEARRLIRACRRPMRDGTAAFPPQVGAGYNAFWLRDYAYMVEGCGDAFTDRELIDACRLFVGAGRADGACVDCVKFDGTPIYKPGMGTMGENPVADGSQFTIDVAWHAYRRTHDHALVRQIIDRLVKAIRAVPRNPQTGLVHIRPGPGYDRCPYGFTDTVRKQGDELFSSLLLVQAARQLADLLDAAGRPGAAQHWRTEADRVAAGIRQVFWDPPLGLFRAATVQCREPDIWGSAFAVYLDVASQEQSLAVAKYFATHYAEIVQHGQVRHLPGGMYWEKACPKDQYQNGGFWATPVGWFVYTLDLADPGLADRTVVEMVRDFQRRGVVEWVFREKVGVTDYVANAALPLAGIDRMIQRRRQQR
jgi:hypothetical protein